MNEGQEETDGRERVLVNEEAVRRSGETPEKSGVRALIDALGDADQHREREQADEQGGEIVDEQLELELEVGHQIEVVLLLRKEQLNGHHLFGVNWHAGLQ